MAAINYDLKHVCGDRLLIRVEDSYIQYQNHFEGGSDSLRYLFALGALEPSPELYIYGFEKSARFASGSTVEKHVREILVKSAD